LVTDGSLKIIYGGIMKKVTYIIIILLLIVGYFYIYPERCEKLLGDENLICELGW
jgi:hypothetical protein